MRVLIISLGAGLWIALAQGAEYVTPVPITGETEEEQQINAERICRFVCRDHFGWNYTYRCTERPYIGQDGRMHYRVLGCFCECGDE
jgi:hypothetical protein